MSLRVVDDPGEQVLLLRVLAAVDLQVFGVVRLAAIVRADGDADVPLEPAVRGDELEAIDVAILVQVHVPAEGSVPVDDFLLLSFDDHLLRIPVPAKHVSAAHRLGVDGRAEVERNNRSRSAVEQAERALQLWNLVDETLLEVRAPLLARKVMGTRVAVVQIVEVMIDRSSTVECRFVGRRERVGLSHVHGPRVERHADGGAGERRAGGDALRRGLGEITELHEDGAAVAALVQPAELLPDAHQLRQPALDARGRKLTRLQVGERDSHRNLKPA